jgi:dephospho-CoA kinase
MLKIGITGGIGSGKTEVCKIIERLGSKVIFADDLAKEILNTDENVKRRVGKEFGEDIYTSTGNVNSKKLAQKIFFDENLKVKLEKIVHPVVIDKIKKDFQSLEKSSKHSIGFLEAALIFEAGVDSFLDYIIVVNASEENCINRVMTRDGSRKEDVMQRIKAQIPPAQKIEKADFVIHNNDDRNKLENNVKFIYNLLNLMSKTKS